MKSPKHVFLFTTVLLLSMIGAACSGSTSSGGYGSGGSTSSGRYSSGGSTPAVTTPSTAGANVAIQTATAAVKGKSATILTNAQGMTLYYLSADTATQSMCSGSCSKIWPPLVVTGSALPSGPSTLPGKLSLVSTANGSQVEYNGHPLYTYSGDNAPGQTNGEGVLNVWHVVTPDLKLQGGASNPYSY